MDFPSDGLSPKQIEEARSPAALGHEYSHLRLSSLWFFVI